jgi:ech hydrogenase subunit F
MYFIDMAKIVLKSVFSKPATRLYPFEKKEYPKNYRGHISIDEKSCIFCGLCERKCPTSAIKVDNKSKVWEIDRLRCITCLSCVEVCPKKCLSMINQYSSSTTTKDIEVHKNA